MAMIVGVRFKNAGKLYYFDPGQLWPTAGSFVIVETARGVEYGQVITGVREVSDQLITMPLKKLIRLADERDAQHYLDNQTFEQEAYKVCQRKIDEHNLDMKLVGVEQTFDNQKILFYFTANGRVDFRSLVKDLASVFRTRIELRQIGVRDEAKMLGGLGPCGRSICCGSFLGDFQPVSIKMAKEQSLSLNPTKISGVCGRLMCCLKYEEDNYEQTRKRLPRVGKDVETPDGIGVVVDLNVLKETVTARVRKGDTTEFKTYPAADLKWTRPAPQPPRERPEPQSRPAPIKPAPVKAKTFTQPVQAPDEVIEDAPVELETESQIDDSDLYEMEALVAAREQEVIAKQFRGDPEIKKAEKSPWLAAVEQALHQVKPDDDDTL